MDTAPMTLSCTESASRLGTLLTELSSNPSEDLWLDVELICRHLANLLRVRNGTEDNHTALGGGALPQDITSLLFKALNGSSIPNDARATTVFEILRVSANLCVEHDQNRGQLLEARFPQAIVSLLEGYTDHLPSQPQDSPLPLSISHLQVIKTAIGFLLNSSLGYGASIYFTDSIRDDVQSMLESVKFRLTSLEVAKTLVRLSSAIYPVGAWMKSPTSLFPSESPGLNDISERVAESWTIRIGISNWTWRLIAELRDDAHPLFDTDVLPFLVQSLIAFTPPLLTVPPPPDFAQPSRLRTSLLHADFDLLSEACSNLESLVLDVEDFRLSLARGFVFPAEHQNVPCLSVMLNFIEQGNYAPLWYVQHETSLDDSEVRSQEKAFDDCKAAVIKAVVEVSGEEKNTDVLCDDSEETYPGGKFVSRMVNWIRAFVTGTNGNLRDDMAICATLSLGNLTRREFHASLLLSPPHNIAQLLSSESLLSPTTDLKLKHGVIGLLKHLSQSSIHSAANRTALSNAGIIERVVSSGVWDDRSDVMADIVQVSAIGVVKHLCNNSIDNSFAFILPSDGAASLTTGLPQLLALIKRSDTVAIKSEGTRVIVNLIKSLWSSDVSTGQRTPQEIQMRQQKKERAIQALVTLPCVDALAALVGRSAKYPILINEAVVALSLLSTHQDGGQLVLRALITPLPNEANSATPGSAAMSTVASTSSNTGSPIITSPPARNRAPLQKRALDYLLNILRNGGSDDASSPRRSELAPYPVELRMNICALIGQLAKRIAGEEAEMVKDSARSILEDLSKSNSNTEKENMLATAAKKSLDLLDLEKKGGI